MVPAEIERALSFRVCCGHVSQSAHHPFPEFSGGCGHGSLGEWEIEGAVGLECPQCHHRVDQGGVAFFLEAFVSSKDLIRELGGALTFTFSKKTAEPFFMLTQDDPVEEDDLPD